nr:MAG: hypothetical protein [Bacteriophage sp.]
MIISKYTAENGVVLPAAAFVLTTANIYTHSVEIDSTVTEQKDMECIFSVYASEEAYTEKKIYFEQVQLIVPYDSTKLLESQAYDALKVELGA